MNADPPGHGGPRANAGGARPGAGRPRKVRPPAAAPPAEGPRWFCARTRWGAGLEADIDIRAKLGFDVFAPSIWVPASPRGRDRNGRMRPGRPGRIIPMFQQYLFVRFDRTADDWRPIWHLPSVECLFGSSPVRPTVVPDHAIGLIRELCAVNECQYADNRRLLDGAAAAIRPAAIEAGTRLRLTGGVMAGLAGFCTWSDGFRVQLLMEMMGGKVPVWADQADVAAEAA